MRIHGLGVEEEQKREKQCVMYHGSQFLFLLLQFFLWHRLWVRYALPGQRKGYVRCCLLCLFVIIIAARGCVNQLITAIECRYGFIINKNNNTREKNVQGTIVSRAFHPRQGDRLVPGTLFRLWIPIVDLAIICVPHSLLWFLPLTNF